MYSEDGVAGMGQVIEVPREVRRSRTSRDFQSSGSVLSRAGLAEGKTLRWGRTGGNRGWMRCAALGGRLHCMVGARTWHREEQVKAAPVNECKSTRLHLTDSMKVSKMLCEHIDLYHTRVELNLLRTVGVVLLSTAPRGGC